MNLLLDTHAFLWATGTNSGQLSASAKKAIIDGSTVVYVSAATAWELAIKESIGKITVKGGSYHELIRRHRFSELPISSEHARAVAKLPMLHKDPFDRLLIAQAQIENLVLVTRDIAIQKYDVRVLIA